MKRRKYQSAIEYKLKNRRVAVFRNEGQTDLSIAFKKLLAKEESLKEIQSTLYCGEYRGIVETGLSISYEAGIALYKALGEFIKLSDIPSHLLNKEENEQI